MRRPAALALLALAATWGASYLFIAVALRTTTPATITLLRFAPAALLVAAVARQRGGRVSYLRGRWRAVAILALVQMAAPMLLIAVGERYVDSGLAGTLVASAPVFAALLAPVLGRPSPSVTGWVGLCAGLAGVALLLGATTSGTALLGAALVLLAAVGYAFGAAWTTSWFPGVHRETLLAGVLAMSTAWLVPPALLDRPSRWLDLPGTASLLTLGIGGTGVAFLLLYWLIGEVGPERSLLVTYLAPAFALGYGAAVLHEHVGVASLAGLALVVSGAWLAARRPKPVVAPVPVPAVVAQ